MFKYYFKIAIRNLLKNKAFSLINLLGLSIGTVCCLLIFLYVQDELSFDKHHQNGDRIFRVYRKAKMDNAEDISCGTTPPMAAALKQDFPEIDGATRISSWNFEDVVQFGDKKFFEKQFLAADSNLFTIFTIPFVEGNPQFALSQPNSIVFTEKMVTKYFGEIEPLGKTVRFLGRDFQVTGVIENCPRHSHLQYDFIFSINSLRQLDNKSWFQHALMTYVLLNEGASESQLEAKLPAFVKRHLGPFFNGPQGTIDDFFAKGYYYNLYLQPLSDIYLNSEIEHSPGLHGSYKSVFILSAIGIFILLIAAINYFNLTTALSTRRNKEVAVRRIVGSRRRNIVWQFVTESSLMTIGSFLLGLFLLELLLPAFNQFSGKEIEFSTAYQPVLIVSFLGLFLLLGFASIVFASSFFGFANPVNILKFNFGSSKGRKFFRSGLVIFQFVICVAIIIGVIVVNRQLNFMKSKELGFNRQNTLVIHNAEIYGQNRKTLKRELLQIAGVNYVVNINENFGQVFNNMGHKLENGKTGSLYTFNADYDFPEAFGVNMAQGRFFSREIPTDESAVVINEAGAKMLELEEPIGKRFMRDKPYTIIGVVENFHFNSLHHAIKPLIIYLCNEYWGGNVYLKIQSENTQQTVAEVKQIWNRLTGNRPFVWSFLSDEINGFYSESNKTQAILTFFSAIATFIACLGLLGLVSFFTMQRTKEIAIRKVVGSSTLNITSLLVKNFVKWIALANLIAWPLAWLAMNAWLQNFAYRINVSWWIFALAGSVTLLIAVLTVSWQAIRAATANPVEALRYE